MTLKAHYYDIYRESKIPGWNDGDGDGEGKGKGKEV